METTVDLQPFCDNENGRYALSQQFVRSKWRCACDGRIIARVPCDEPDTPAEVGKFPDAKPLFDKFPSEGFSSIDDAITKTEEDPDGSLMSCSCLREGRCNECHGIGATECRTCGQECDCDDCDGTGKAMIPNPSCKQCGGDGEVLLIRCKVRDSWFAARYIDKIRALPNVEVAVVGTASDGMLAFRFDGGGQGLLMCMKY